LAFAVTDSVSSVFIGSSLDGVYCSQVATPVLYRVRCLMSAKL
jgi:hypothetical protein